jgi:hypothetical protein
MNASTRSRPSTGSNADGKGYGVGDLHSKISIETASDAPETTEHADNSTSLVGLGSSIVGIVAAERDRPQEKSQWRCASGDSAGKVDTLDVVASRFGEVSYGASSV